MNYNISPRASAQADPDFTKAHRLFVESGLLEAHMRVALAEYLYQLHRDGPENQEQAAANHWKMVGAHELVRTFRNLVETAEVPTRQDANLSLNKKG